MATIYANNVQTTKAFGKSIDTIYDDMFNVGVSPILMPEGYDFANETYNNVLDIKNRKVLGIVKKLYQPLQQNVMLESMLNACKEIGVSEENLSYSIDDNGRKFRMRLALKPIEFINNVQKGEEIQTFLNLQTGYDGNTSTSVFIETLRLVCTNGMKMANTEFTAKFRNISSNQTAILDLMHALPLALKHAENTKDLFMDLDKQVLTRQQITEFFNQLDSGKFGTEAQEKFAKTKTKETIFSKFQESLEIELARTGSTKFGVLNAVTHYTNHIARNSQVNGSHNIDAIYNGSQNKLNNKALELLLQF